VQRSALSVRRARAIEFDRRNILKLFIRTTLIKRGHIITARVCTVPGTCTDYDPRRSPADAYADYWQKVAKRQTDFFRAERLRKKVHCHAAFRPRRVTCHKKEDRGVCILKLRPGKLDLGAGQLRMHSQTQQRTLHGSPSVGSFDQCRIKGFFKDFS
jgi:hypothetical protein